MKTKMITMLLTAMLLTVFCCAGTANAKPDWLSCKATKVEVIKNPKQNNKKAADYYNLRVTYVLKNNSRNKIVKALYNQVFAYSAVLQGVRSSGVPIKGKFQNVKPLVCKTPVWPGQTITYNCTFRFNMNDPELQWQVNDYQAKYLRSNIKQFKFGWDCGVKTETLD